MGEIVGLAVIVAVVAALVLYVVPKELRLTRALKQGMASRGLLPDSTSPRLQPKELRFDPRFGWRGALAGRSLQFFVGRAFGPRISPDAKITSTAQFFYIWVLLPASPPFDDAWLARWQGDARAVRQDDGSVLVYWQRDYTVENVDGVVAEIEGALR